MRADQLQEVKGPGGLQWREVKVQFCQGFIGKRCGLCEGV